MKDNYFYAVISRFDASKPKSQQWERVDETDALPENEARRRFEDFVIDCTCRQQSEKAGAYYLIQLVEIDENRSYADHRCLAAGTPVEAWDVPDHYEVAFCSTQPTADYDPADDEFEFPVIERPHPERLC